MTHLIAAPGDRRTLCGQDSRRVGVGWVAFLDAWREGHARSGNRLEVCPECLAGLEP